MIHDKGDVVSASSYAGGFFAVMSALTLTQWGILVGILTALLTFGFNVWFQYRRHQRKELEHRLRTAGLLEDLPPECEIPMKPKRRKWRDRQRGNVRVGLAALMFSAAGRRDRCRPHCCPERW